MPYSETLDKEWLVLEQDNCKYAIDQMWIVVEWTLIRCINMRKDIIKKFFNNFIKIEI